MPFIRKNITEQEALLKLTALCSGAEHCRQEMQEKLLRWGITEDAQQRILDYLEDERYINDERFARGFIHDKMEYNGWGRRKIEQALWLKRIPKDVSKPLLDDISNEKWAERLHPIIASKRRMVKADSAYEMNQKLYRFALSRGFSFDVIRMILDADDLDESVEETEYETGDGSSLNEEV